MRKATLVLLSTLALFLGLSVHAVAANPPYKVSIKTSITSSYAGRFLAVTGAVTGPKAVGKAATIQRRYSGGTWITVATTTIKTGGYYAARVETPRGGTTSFRTLVTKSSVRAAGTSPTKSIPVYEWISLATANSLHDSFVLPGVQEDFDGKALPSIDVYGNTDMMFKLGGLCTKLTAIADYRDSGATQSINLTYLKTPIGAGPPSPVSVVVTKGTPVATSTSVSGQRVLTLETTGYDSSYKLVIGNPRVYCNAHVLPAWTLDELK